MKKAGLVQGRYSSCLFYQQDEDVAIRVYGDDSGAFGDPKHLAETEAALSEKYKIKTETLGDGPGDVK